MSMKSVKMKHFLLMFQDFFLQPIIKDRPNIENMSDIIVRLLGWTMDVWTKVSQHPVHFYLLYFQLVFQMMKIAQTVSLYRLITYM